MKLKPDLQVRLLALSERRTRLDGASARREALSERAELTRLLAERSRGRAASASSSLATRDLDIELRRVTREHARLLRREKDERAALRTIVEPRRRRDVERGLHATVRRREDAAARLRELQDRRDAHARHAGEAVGDLDERIGAARRALGAAEESLAAEERRITAGIGRLREGLDARLLARFDRREAEVGVAAARLDGRVCGSCFMELSHSTVRELDALPADRMPECPECGAWLVRSPAIAAAGADARALLSDDPARPGGAA
ncbi:zinc ribbon domain-containing protein [Corynebacterium sp. 335C]